MEERVAQIYLLVIAAEIDIMRVAYSIRIDRFLMYGCGACSSLGEVVLRRMFKKVGCSRVGNMIKVLFVYLNICLHILGIVETTRIF